MKRLTDEECRILIAAEEGRLFMNKNGRYEIDQEERPDRRTRENLRKKGLLSWRMTEISATGADRLRRELHARANERLLAASSTDKGERTDVG